MTFWITRAQCIHGGIGRPHARTRPRRSVVIMASCLNAIPTHGSGWIVRLTMDCKKGTWDLLTAGWIVGTCTCCVISLSFVNKEGLLRNRLLFVSDGSLGDNINGGVGAWSDVLRIVYQLVSIRFHFPWLMKNGFTCFGLCNAFTEKSHSNSLQSSPTLAKR